MKYELASLPGGKTKHIRFTLYNSPDWNAICGAYLGATNLNPSPDLKSCKRCLYIIRARLKNLQDCVSALEQPTAGKND